MNLSDVRHLLLAQSAEESDPRTVILPEVARDAASSDAGAPLAETASESEQRSFLIRRSERIVSYLEPRQEAIAEATKSVPLGRFRWFAIAVAVLAVAGGFLSNELGPEKRINILAFPILGILLWNLFVYVFELIGLFRKSSAKTGGLDRWLAKSPSMKVVPEGKDETPVEIRQTLALFRKNWTKALLPVIGARAKSLLHMAALLIAASAIGGMYVKGLANEYKAIWESTFFTAENLHPFLKMILGPASMISGISLPDVDGLKAIGGATSEGESAANWIHLYAVTIGIFVIIPRTILWVIWQGRARFRENTVPFRSFAPAYFDRLLAVSMGDALKISVLPYAHNPSDDARTQIQKKAEDIIGGAVKLDWLPPIPFGEEDGELPIESWPADLIVLFNFASTPEKETHGALLKNIVKSIREAEATTHYHLFLDAESFNRKADSFADSDQRRETRSASWRELAGVNFGEKLHVVSPK